MNSHLSPVLSPETLNVQVTALYNEGLPLLSDPRLNTCNVQLLRQISRKYIHDTTIGRFLDDRNNFNNRKSVQHATGITTECAKSISFLQTCCDRTIPANSTVEILFSDCVGMLLCQYGNYLGWIESKCVVQRVC
jgi:type IV secretory pathway ATPase VirB11/archaellum biosynthesis ATPase